MARPSPHPAGDALPPARRRLILLIKLLHSLIYLLMVASIAYLYVAAIAGRFDRWLWLVLAALAVELIALLLSGRRCPLTLLALRLGDETGDDLIADLLLPKSVVRRTVPVCAALMVVGLLLVLVAGLRAL